MNYRFLLKIAVYYTAWFTFYEFILKHNLQTLSENYAQIVASLNALLGWDVFISAAITGIAYSKGIHIIPGCTAVDTIGIFTGFVIVSRSQWSAKLHFLFLGVLLIYAVNIFRLLATTWLVYFDPENSQYYHDLTTSWIFNTINLGLWYYFGKTMGFQVYS